MTLRLTDEETEELRRQAEREHRSMQEVVRLAVRARIEASQRSDFVRAETARIMTRDAELLDRLSR